MKTLFASILLASTLAGSAFAQSSANVEPVRDVKNAAVGDEATTTPPVFNNAFTATRTEQTASGRLPVSAIESSRNVAPGDRNTTLSATDIDNIRTGSITADGTNRVNVPAFERSGRAYGVSVDGVRAVGDDNTTINASAR